MNDMNGEISCLERIIFLSQTFRNVCWGAGKSVASPKARQRNSYKYPSPSKSGRKDGKINIYVPP